MATRYDLEMLLTDVLAVMTDNLNTKITSINTEKNDSITLSQVNSSAYFLQTMDAAQANFSPFILYGVEDILSVASGPGTAKHYQLQVALLMENLDEPNIAKRMFRYSRALEEIFQENWHLLNNGIKLNIQSLVPENFVALNTTRPYHVVGLRLQAVLS